MKSLNARPAFVWWALCVCSGCTVELDAASIDLVTCQSARDCPSDLVCAQDVQVCRPAADKCIQRSGQGYAAVVDGSPCQTVAGESGICVRAACTTSFCGDGFADTNVTGEECDDGAANSDVLPGACRSDCRRAHCGDGILDPGEVCDGDVGLTNGRCRADCFKIELCGDAVIDSGEECDDGNANPVDGCDACLVQLWSATSVVGAASTSSVRLSGPQQLAVGLDGTLYIADPGNHRVYARAPDGAVRVVAGTGEDGFSGDGGLAIAARLSSPTGVAVDGLNRVFIADSANHRVRVVDPKTERIGTVAGSAPLGGAGGFSGDGGQATAARLNLPVAVAVDGRGRLYIADQNNHRIRRVDTEGVITTFAGTRAAGAACATYTLPGVDICLLEQPSNEMKCPQGVALDAQGRVLVADTSSHRLLRFSAAGTNQETLAGTLACGTTADGAPAAGAAISFPRGVFAGADGSIYFTESDASTSVARVRRIDATGLTLSTVAGGALGSTPDGEPSVGALIQGPHSVVVLPDGAVVFSEQDNRIVRGVADGRLQTLLGASTARSPDDGLQASSVIIQSSGLALGAAGDLFFGDWRSYVWKWRRADGTLTAIAGNGKVGRPIFGDALASPLDHPDDIAVDMVGNVYIADSGNDGVYRVDALTGVMQRVAGNGASGATTPEGDGEQATSVRIESPIALALDHSGRLYLLENRRFVRRVELDGTLVTVAGGGDAFVEGGPATGAELIEARDIAIDAQDRLLIADRNAYRLYRVDTAGMMTAVAGDGAYGSSPDGTVATAASLGQPECLATRGDVIAFCESSTDKLRTVDADGRLGTLAGIGASFNLAGEGLSAALAPINPVDAVFDDAGDLFLADRLPSPLTIGSRIRRIEAGGGRIFAVAGVVDLPRMGPTALATLANPVALAALDDTMLIAGGDSGTVQRLAGDAVSVAAGRYQQVGDSANLARFRGFDFGDVDGITVDTNRRLIYASLGSDDTVVAIDPVDPGDTMTWTISDLLDTGLNHPTGLFFDAAADRLYVADTGNHAVRAIDLSSQPPTVIDVAGRVGELGIFGDGGAATSARLFEPGGVTVCNNGDLFIADTGNHRVRRVVLGASPPTISTVLGNGVATSSGDGAPATTFPVDTPRQLVCDAFGNLFVTSRTTLRELTPGISGDIDGTGGVTTIFDGGGSGYACIGAVAVESSTSLLVADACVGALLRLTR